MSDPLVQPGAKLGPWVVKSVEGAVRAVHETLGIEAELAVEALSQGAEDQDAAHLARAAHEHVFSAAEVGKTETHTWRVAKLVGPRLVDRLDAPFERAEVERIIRALASGLAHVRASGLDRLPLIATDVVHEPGGRIGWFGLAARLAATRPETDRHVKGLDVEPLLELAWASPGVGQSAKASESDDVFALGAILHGLLALAPPLRLEAAKGAIETMQTVLSGERSRPSAVRAGVDPLLDRVCARAIDRDPAARYPSVAAFLEALSGAPEPSAPSGPVAKVLQPGEVVRFERHPLGWPPLTGRMVIAYGALLLLAALPAFAGVQLSFDVQNLTVPVPVMVPALALVAIIEALRFTAFRSRLYVATNRRVLVLGGLFSTKLRGDLARERMRGLQLVGTEPAIALEERKILLSGLDAVDLDSVRTALGEPLLPVLPPAKIRAKRRWRRPLALLAAVLFAVFVEVEGWVQRVSMARFQATTVKVRTAVVAAEAAICSLIAIETGDAVQRKNNQGDYSNPFMEQSRIYSLILVGKDELVAIETRLERVRNVIPLDPNVQVRKDREAPWNARFLVELKLELAREGIEADWPK